MIKVTKIDKPDDHWNTVELQFRFEHGDADFETIGSQKMPMTFEELTTDEVRSEATLKLNLDHWLMVKAICDVNNRNYMENYNDIEAKHGEKIADSWDYVDNDRTTDGQTKCSIDGIDIIGYDSNGQQYSIEIGQ